MELSDAEQQQLGKKLLLLKAEIEQLLGDSVESSRPVDLGLSIGRLSRVDALQQQAMAKANREAHQRRLVLIDAALRTLKSGRYGLCRSCDEPISLKRLEARPETPFCIECQTEREGN
ncbi:TraR/DksA family transcriptional regulator [Pelovirga terrestris]|uniref:TraR/DksA family transcriptional regulator n=1 Tax=Pelovirga terrestris TaxID=2771352 RepID=A0A8J6QN74_9BACT|nr:TraR/DksA family transcriptional regulator [Pelovirga terrestris]MBD1400043.1 TraR/DksA family transcriptional regulator [Pelovirga terrestris]